MRRLVLLAVLAAAVGAQSLQTVPARSGRDRRAYADVVRKLSRLRLDVDWQETSLREAVAELRARTGLNVVLGRDVRDLEEEPLGFRLERVHGLALVKLIEERLGVVFLHQRGILHVTTPEDALKRSVVLSIQDVRDLLYVPPDFPGPDIGVRVGRPVEPDPPEPKEQRDIGELIDLVRMATGGDEAWEREGVSLAGASGKLIIRHTVEMQRKVRRFLARMRGAL